MLRLRQISVVAEDVLSVAISQDVALMGSVANVAEDAAVTVAASS